MESGALMQILGQDWRDNVSLSQLIFLDHPYLRFTEEETNYKNQYFQCEQLAYHFTESE